LKPEILNTEVQTFLEQHLDSDLNRMILKGSPFENISVQELAEQIKSRRKCRLKLPLWYSTQGILYPPTLNVEQSSSELAAQYKASLVKGKRMIDLTGGFGVDAFYFSSKFDSVTYLEMNRELQEIVKHNLKVLNADNVVCLLGDSIELLRSSDEKFDWIYVDPSRRDGQEERVFRLEDCSPNLVENLELILSKSDRILLKLAPFMDISKALGQLNNVAQVHVLAIDNEVKELLFLIRSEKPEFTRIKAVNLIKGRVEIVKSEPGSAHEISYGPVDEYLYEPNAAIRKAGLYSFVASQYNLSKVHPNSHLFTSQELVDFPGRVFRVKKQIRYSPKRIKKELGLKKANITTRNFHDSVAQIRKRTGIKEGGEDYLFFTTDYENKSIALVCSKA
jgi:16S rRNA G966 N2-methylase RsmD